MCLEASFTAACCVNVILVDYNHEIFHRTFSPFELSDVLLYVIFLYNHLWHDVPVDNKVFRDALTQLIFLSSPSDNFLEASLAYRIIPSQRLGSELVTVNDHSAA